MLDLFYVLFCRITKNILTRKQHKRFRVDIRESYQSCKM